MPAELDPEQRELVADYWWQRATGEITSWVGFQHVLDDLRTEGSPAPIVALAERAVDDEWRHAQWCRDWAMRFGHPGGELRPRSEAPMTLAASAAADRLLRIAFCCFTESVGCFILRRVRPVVVDPELRKLNRRHLADELRHSRVGWGYLATLDEARRQVLADWVPRLLCLLPQACCEGGGEEREELVPYGYFTPSVLREAHDEAVSEIILPGLDHLGIRSAA